MEKKMKIKFKKMHPRAVIPTYAKQGHAAMDVSRTSMALANSVGVVDSGYRGEIMLKYRHVNNLNSFYKSGDRVGQLMIMPYPQFELIEVEELSTTERGEGGFGSTGS